MGDVMSEYRRFLSYMYAYNDDQKGRNVGFVKVEVRNEQKRITVNLRNMPEAEGQDLEIYAFYRQEENCIGALLGKIFIKSGAGQFYYSSLGDYIANSSCHFTDVSGIIIRSLKNSRQNYATIWDEDEISFVYFYTEQEKKAGMLKAASLESKNIQEEKIEKTQEKYKTLESENTEGKEKYEALEDNLMSNQILESEKSVDYSKSVEADISKKEKDYLEYESLENKENAEENLNCQDMKADLEIIVDRGIPLSDTNNMVTQREINEKNTKNEEYSKDFNYIPNIKIIKKQSSKNVGEDILFNSEVYDTTSQMRNITNREYISELQEKYLRSTFISTEENEEIRTDEPSFDITELKTDIAKKSVPKDEMTESAKVPANIINISDSLKNQRQNLLNSDTDIKDFSKIITLDEKNSNNSADKSNIISITNSPKNSMSENKIVKINYDKPEKKDEETIPWRKLCKLYPKIQPFTYEKDIECLQIKPADIGRLPRQNWIMANNSFLLHGYFNYRYLILAKMYDENKVEYYILGVPGIYHNNEKFMAEMFGFEYFKPSAQVENQMGTFGYWYIKIELDS